MKKTDIEVPVRRQNEESLRFENAIHFAERLEREPIERVLRDLPSIATSESRLSLATRVLTRRIQQDRSCDPAALVKLADEVSRRFTDSAVRDRVRSAIRIATTRKAELRIH